MWFTPQIRVYEDADGIFQQLHEEIIAEDIVRQRIANGEYETLNFTEDERQLVALTAMNIEQYLIAEPEGG